MTAIDLAPRVCDVTHATQVGGTTLADMRIFGIWSRNYTLRTYFAADIEDALDQSHKVRHTRQRGAIRKWQDLTDDLLKEYPAATKQALATDQRGPAEYDAAADTWVIDTAAIE